MRKKTIGAAITLPPLIIMILPESVTTRFAELLNRIFG